MPAAFRSAPTSHATSTRRFAGPTRAVRRPSIFPAPSGPRSSRAAFATTGSTSRPNAPPARAPPSIPIDGIKGSPDATGRSSGFADPAPSRRGEAEEAPAEPPDHAPDQGARDHVGRPVVAHVDARVGHQSRGDEKSQSRPRKNRVEDERGG